MTISFAMQAGAVGDALHEFDRRELAEMLEMLVISYDTDPEVEYIDHAWLTIDALMTEATTTTDKVVIGALMDAYAAVRSTLV
jgi:hypothetical protein